MRYDAGECCCQPGSPPCLPEACCCHYANTGTGDCCTEDIDCIQVTIQGGPTFQVTGGPFCSGGGPGVAGAELSGVMPCADPTCSPTIKIFCDGDGQLRGRYLMRAGCLQYVARTDTFDCNGYSIPADPATGFGPDFVIDSFLFGGIDYTCCPFGAADFMPFSEPFDCACLHLLEPTFRLVTLSKCPPPAPVAASKATRRLKLRGDKMIRELQPGDDPPCVLTTLNGTDDWCDRHRERHPAGTAVHRLSQERSLSGVRFRRMRDAVDRRRGGRGPGTVVAGASPKPGAFGPGTGVAQLLLRRKIVASPGCSCKQIMQDMDAAGVEGCRVKVADFAKRMRRNATFMSWEGRLAASMNVAVLPAVKAVWARLTGGPAPEERPFFSFSALILEACDLAEQSQKAAAPLIEGAQTAEDKPITKEFRQDGRQVVGVERPDGSTAIVEAQQKLMKAAQCVEPVSPPRPHKAPIRWAVGLTAVPSRRSDLLPRTLKSLENAGFSGEFAPRLFVDGDRGPWGEFANEATFRFPSFARGGTPAPWGNWWLGLQELYLRCPDCDRYAMFQDDVAAVRNLRAYLEASPFPERGYLNLFAFMDNDRMLAQEPGPPGWTEAALLAPPSSISGAALEEFNAKRAQCGRGALALVFDREGLVELLRFKDAVERPLEHPAGRGLARIDGGVVDSMNKLGRREWTHRPSLVQHTGTLSAVSRRAHPETRELEPRRWRIEALTFPGEDFDAMDFLKTGAAAS